MGRLNKGKVVLINPNNIKPLVAPIALDYLASSLKAMGHQVDILDLSFVSDFKAAVKNYFKDNCVDVVGITIRNTDDCYYASREFFIPGIKEVVREIKKLSDAPVVLGGCGFSILPAKILEFCGADFGIRGEGERSFDLLVDGLPEGKDISDIPGLVYRSKGGYLQNEPGFVDLDAAGSFKRGNIDNPRYFREGGQGNIETKRGCNKSCTYCADPVAKGRKIRVRSPRNVVAELESLFAGGIDCFHFCDSEFNNPVSHAVSICRELISSGLSEKIRWYTYACPAPFPEELAFLMKRAGCAGIDFGIDSGDEAMLRTLGRDFSVSEIVETAEFCHKAGVVFMYDLLLGGPGETKESLRRTIELMKRISPGRVGLSVGIRIYPETKLAEMITGSGAMSENPSLVGCVDGNEDFLRPVFYLDSNVAADISAFLASLIGDDKRFFFANPDNRDQNYNYNENEVLVEAVKKGYRGAYWDILRKLSEDHAR